jgi:hypothetical protein
VKEFYLNGNAAFFFLFALFGYSLWLHITK